MSKHFQISNQLVSSGLVEWLVLLSKKPHFGDAAYHNDLRNVPRPSRRPFLIL